MATLREHDARTLAIGTRIKTLRLNCRGRGDGLGDVRKRRRQPGRRRRVDILSEATDDAGAARIKANPTERALPCDDLQRRAFHHAPRSCSQAQSTRPKLYFTAAGHVSASARSRVQPQRLPAKRTALGNIDVAGAGCLGPCSTFLIKSGTTHGGAAAATRGAHLSTFKESLRSRRPKKRRNRWRAALLALRAQLHADWQSARAGLPQLR